jgi:uncharacterized PurR-regulated membrane protein YhhQ (DUF165 family)
VTVTLTLPWSKPPVMTLNEAMRSSNVHAKAAQTRAAKDAAIWTIRARRPPLLTPGGTLTLAAAYLASIVAAAYAITHIGTQYFPGAPHVVPVWPGIEAPSGVYVVGVTLVIRDLLQHRISKPVMFGLIAVGAGLAALVSPAVAVASGCAFLASETVDWATYTTGREAHRLRARHPRLERRVSIVVDSAVFLWLAFGSLAFLEGQVIGKALATIGAFALLVALRVASPGRDRVTDLRFYLGTHRPTWLWTVARRAAVHLPPGAT